MADTWRLGTYLVVQGVVGALSFLLPQPVGAVLRLAVAGAGVGLLVVAVLVRRPMRRAGWWLIALSGALTYVSALAVVTTPKPGSRQEFESLPELVLVVAAALALAVGLAVLGWRNGEGRWDILDTAITATGTFLLVWVFYIDPNLARSASAFATVVAVAIPASSLLVFGMAVKLALSGAATTWAGRMLLLSTAAGLCAAFLVAGPIGAPTVAINEPIRASWLAQSILVGAAGLAPGFAEVVGKPRRPAAMEVPVGRLLLFIVLALVAPLNVAVGFKQAGARGPALAAIIVPPLCGTLIFLILVARLVLVAKVARGRADELSDRSASLAAALARQDELQVELEYRADHDPLTGLANRDALAGQIETARESGGGSNKVASRGQAIIMMDLDGFKQVNDTLGHPAGDQVLVDVSERLKAVLPDSALVARLGGDEFAVLLENTPGDGARRAAEAVKEALRAPYAIDGQQVTLSASIGLLVIETGAQAARYTEGLRESDRAMYAAKSAGGNRVIEAGAGSATG